MRYTPNEREVDAKIDNQYTKAHTDFGIPSRSRKRFSEANPLDRTSHHSVPPNCERVGISRLSISTHVDGHASRRLQVRTTSGEYKYVQYIPGHVVVNVRAKLFTTSCLTMLKELQTAEVLTFLSGGYIKSTVHRVVRPPGTPFFCHHLSPSTNVYRQCATEDQAYIKRLGLLYFSRLANDFDVKVAPSPLLQRLGLYDPAKEDPNPPKGLGSSYSFFLVSHVTDEMIIEWGRARVKHTHNKVVFEHVDHPVTPFKYGNHEINLECKLHYTTIF